jgi:hypothetical protein
MILECITQPNWAQIVSALAAILAIIISFIVAILLYNLKKQQDLKANQAQSYLKLLERMEKIRSDRQLLRKYISSKKGLPDFTDESIFWEKLNLLSEETIVEFSDENDKILKIPIKDILSKVTREFDILGFMDRSELISPKMVDQFYAAPLVDFIPIFTAYINLLRTVEIPKRDETHLWELEQFMQRVINVKNNHPGKSGKGTWPKNSRKKPKLDKKTQA